MVQLGFVFVRQPGAPRFESFFNQIIAGLEDALSASSSTLIVKRVENQREELEVYRHWHASGAVDAVIIKDLLVDDGRIDQLQRRGMSFVALGDVTQTGNFTAVRIDNARAMRDSMAFLVGLGHRSIARVTGQPELLHTAIRTDVFVAEAAAAGVASTVVPGDYSQSSGELATRELLAAGRRPTAIVYDNDLMALGGLAAARALGIDVPRELSLLAWDDSMLCQLATPPLSALSHDVHQIGVQVAATVMLMLSTATIAFTMASQPIIVERGTTAGSPTDAGAPQRPLPAAAVPPRQRS